MLTVIWVFLILDSTPIHLAALDLIGEVSSALGACPKPQKKPRSLGAFLLPDSGFRLLAGQGELNVRGLTVRYRYPELLSG